MCIRDRIYSSIKKSAENPAYLTKVETFKKPVPEISFVDTVNGLLSKLEVEKKQQKSGVEQDASSQPYFLRNLEGAINAGSIQSMHTEDHPWLNYRDLSTIASAVDRGLDYIDDTATGSEWKHDGGLGGAT